MLKSQQNSFSSTLSDISYNIRILGPEFNTSLQASTPTIKESVGADCQSSRHPRTTKASLCRDNICCSCWQQTRLCETEMNLIKKREVCTRNESNQYEITK